MEAATLQTLLRMATAPARVQQQWQHLPSLSAIEEHQQHHSKHDLGGFVPVMLERCERWLQQPGCDILHWFHPHYPEALRHAPRPPLVLFIQGDAELLALPQVAIVGSRNASPTGQHNAAYFAEGLAQAKVVVSSGLAQGIDAAAHKAALDTGDTLAVLGTGPDVVYPSRHRQLQQQIADQGLIVSEFVPGTAARRDHFPRRNRILSALAQAVLVIEAKQRSGSLITARLALEQGRQVMAVPGSIWDVGVTGNLGLLQQGATLVISVENVLQELNLPSAGTILKTSEKNISTASLANDGLLANVGNEVTAIDTIVKRSGLPVASVTEQLVLLELEGKVTSVTGGYIKMARR